MRHALATVAAPVAAPPPCHGAERFSCYDRRRDMKTAEETGSWEKDEGKRIPDGGGQRQKRGRRGTPDIVIHCSDANEMLVSYPDVDHTCASPAVRLLSSLPFRS